MAADPEPRPAAVRAVRLIIDNAAPLPPPIDEGALRDQALPPGPGDGLPSDFPVTPLSQSINAKGELLCHYLDPRRRLRSLRDEKHGRLSLSPKPWKISFSCGRALQDPTLEAWHGRDENLAAGQRALCQRAGSNGAANAGKYTNEMEAASSSADDPPHRRDWRDD